MFNENELSAGGRTFKINTQDQKTIAILNDLSQQLKNGDNLKNRYEMFLYLFPKKIEKNSILIPAPDRISNRSLCDYLSQCYKRHYGIDLPVADIFTKDENGNLKINERNELSGKNALFFNYYLTDSKSFNQAKSLLNGIQPLFYYIDSKIIDINYNNGWNVSNRNKEIDYNANLNERILQTVERLYDLENGSKTFRERHEFDETLKIIRDICTGDSCLLNTHDIGHYVLENGREVPLETLLLNDENRHVYNFAIDRHQVYSLRQFDKNLNTPIFYADNRNVLFNNVNTMEYSLVPSKVCYNFINTEQHYRNNVFNNQEFIYNYLYNKEVLIKSLSNYRIASLTDREYKPENTLQQDLINNIQKHLHSFQDLNEYVQTSFIKAEKLVNNIEKNNYTSTFLKETLPVEILNNKETIMEKEFEPIKGTVHIKGKRSQAQARDKIKKSNEDDYNRSIADIFIEGIKSNEAPWCKPCKGQDFLEDFNPSTKTNYSGINALYLGFMREIKYKSDDPRWYTFLNAKDAGYTVKKGEKGNPVVYFSQVPCSKDGKVLPKDDKGNYVGKPEMYKPVRRVYIVFHASQLGIVKKNEEGNTIKNEKGEVIYDPIPKYHTKDYDLPVKEFNPVKTAETILSNSGAKIFYDVTNGPNYYSPGRDEIHYHDKKDFFSAGQFYSTALHELVHWTGSPTRLNRDLPGGLMDEGIDTRAKEELVAEIGSYELCKSLKIDFEPQNHIAYVQSWCKALHDKPIAIFEATKQASAAKDFCLQFKSNKIERQNDDVNTYLEEQKKSR